MLSEKIQSIISQRKRSAAHINSIKDNFSQLITSFEYFMHTCRTYLDNDLLKSERELTEKIFAEYDSGKISELQRDLDNICKRLSRETLNIAVVGKARQGKSRLLRTITDLPQSIIPDSKMGFCTGVRSDIINKPGISETRYSSFLQ